MIKNTIILLIFIWNTSAIFSQSIPSDFFIYKNYDLNLFKNKVNKIKVEHYNKKGENIKYTPIWNTVYEINSEKKIIRKENSFYWEEKKYDNNGLLISFKKNSRNDHNTVYFYNNKKQIEKTKTYDIDGVLKYIYVYKYNINGKLKKRLYYNNDTLLTQMTYYYKNGVLIKSIERSISDKSKKYLSIYKYDKFNNITEIWWNNKLKRKYYYNEKGFKIRAEHFSQYNGELIAVKKFFYNKNNLLEKTISFEKARTGSIFINKYVYF